eukprot:gene2164-352_t
MHQTTQGNGDSAMTEAPVRSLSYLDDLTLVVPQASCRVALDIAREELQSLKLVLNDTKTTIFTKSG